MTLQSSGAISLNNVNVELGRSGTASINMNETAVRTLAGVASGSYGMNSFYGKSYYKYNGTLTQTYTYIYSSPYSYSQEYGASAYSPTTLVDGKTLFRWTDFYTYVGGSLQGSGGQIWISGFSSNPGTGYITDAQVGSGTVRTPTSYYYSSGAGYWDFSIFGFGSSGSVAGKIR